MKQLFAIILLGLGLTGSALAKDHSDDYKIGTFVSATAAADGTITSTLHGNGTTVAGGVYENYVAVYRIKVEDGSWTLETCTQAADSMLRNWGITPAHWKSEKANPLDSLKNGDRVLFRVEQHKKIGGTETDIYIPYADKPNKEFLFIGTFHPNVVPQQAQKPSDNVKAMCNAHKLSPELEKQYCQRQTEAVQPTEMAQQTEMAQPVVPNDYESAMADARKKTEALCGRNSPLDAAARDRWCRFFCALGTLSPDLQTQYCSTK